MKTIIIFNNQLFKDISHLYGKKVILVSQDLFTQNNLSIEQIVFKQASINFYKEYLRLYGIDVEYYEDDSYLNDYKYSDIEAIKQDNKTLTKKLKDNFLSISFFEYKNIITFNNKTYKLKTKRYNKQLELQNAKASKIKVYFDNKFIESAKLKFNIKNEFNTLYPSTFEDANVFLAYYLRKKLIKDNIEEYLDIDNILVNLLNSGIISLQYFNNMVRTFKCNIKLKQKFLQKFVKNQMFEKVKTNKDKNEDTISIITDDFNHTNDYYIR